MQRSRVHQTPGASAEPRRGSEQEGSGMLVRRVSETYMRGQTRGQERRANWGSRGDGTSPGRAASLFLTLTLCVACYTDEAGRRVSSQGDVYLE